MKSLFTAIGSTVVVILGAYLILISTSSFSAPDGSLSDSSSYIRISVPAKQKGFFVTKDYNRALRALNRGYVLQDVTVNNSAGGYEYKYYTLVKY